MRTMTSLPYEDSDEDSANKDLRDVEGGELDLEDRQALRRVAGLSTELHDVTEVEYRALRLERVVLIGVWTDGDKGGGPEGQRGGTGAAQAENSLRELALLAETAGSQVLEGLMQRRSTPDPATYIGSGKAAELSDVVAASGADTVICDGELAPSQLRKLEEIVKVKVIDRTALILDIFAQHARSREGKAQVELAQLEYLMPRLRGWGGNLSRQVGGRAAGGVGIGGRGPGETKIELDRRRIRTRMAKLRRQLAGMSKSRDTMKAERRRRKVPAVAIAGYTNAGKSSLLNRITGAGVLVEDALFATLDPTVRRAQTPSGRVFTLADTVGFVRHLPHQLVEAFRSTLEEVADADLIVHVVDGSDGAPESQVDAVREVLREIGAGDVAELIVVNKSDVADPLSVARLQRREPHSVVVSARTGEGIDELLAAIEGDLPRLDREVRVLLPYERGDLVARIHDRGEVLSQRHTAQGTALNARVPVSLVGELETFIVAPTSS
jgi:GTP-binding protein HflX